VFAREWRRNDTLEFMTTGQTTKASLRERTLSARAAVPPEQRRAESAALLDEILAAAAGVDVVCAYVPVGSEPGSLAALDSLAASGIRVLLPVARVIDDVPAPLTWGAHRPGALVSARFGLREPPPPHEPVDAIAGAALVLVPALAVDHAGVRLGRGAGFYDRTLPLADPTARLVAVVRDDELLPHVPGESHDVPMTHALTPGRGVIPLGANRS
jgi:5-formyltetrahydrofolate cyclo-ligase